MTIAVYVLSFGKINDSELREVIFLFKPERIVFNIETNYERL